MRRLPGLLFAALLLVGRLGAQPADPGAAENGTATATAAPDAAQALTTTAVAAKVAQDRGLADPPDFLEHIVDSILAIFNVTASGNTATHYALSALLFGIALLARRIVTGVIFAVLRRLAAKTATTLDDKLFPSLEGPAAALVMVVGLFSSLKVLKLSPEADHYIAAGAQVAFSLALFWGLWRAFAALLQHVGEVSAAKGLAIAAFMPWIRKALLTAFAVFGVLITLQSFGWDVKTALAGLGIGGLAFALAAQDTIANIFGAIVVAVDQPFRVGETVRIGANVGAIEEIGLRSTRIRLLDGSLMVIPNKTVASDTITNLSRFTLRRTEQVIGLTYDTKPGDMNAIVAEFRRLILAEAEVDPASVLLYFRDFSASSLDIWVVYVAKSPDFPAYMELRQRLNVAFMRAVEARGLSFAFPTQTVHLAGTAAEKSAGR
jgi:MscS family membrane protein